MENELNIIGLELDSIWNNPSENCLQIEILLKNKTADVFLLPEMFNTGFNMNVNETSETMEGQSILWMKSFAKQKNSVIAGSLAIKEAGKFYNRFCWVTSDQEIHYYDKMHLFSYSGEEKIFSSGEEVKIIEYKNWKIALQVCYDLRFPEFIRNTYNYDLIIYVANWPKVRIDSWKALLMARAVENQTYVIGINRLGTDDNSWEYESSSRLVFPSAEVLAKAHNGLLDCKLSKSKLLEFRQKFPFLKDMKKTKP